MYDPHTGSHPDDSIAGHWGLSNAGGRLGGFRYWRLAEENFNGQIGLNLYHARLWGNDFNVPDGLGWSPIDNLVPFSDIEMYLMGLKSAEELRAANFRLVYFPRGRILNEGIVATERVEYTIDDIIARHGQRLPDPSTSQRHFRIATVYLFTDWYRVDQLTTPEVDVFGSIKWFTGPPAASPRGPRRINFAAATHGRATVEMGNMRASRHSDFRPTYSVFLIDTARDSRGISGTVNAVIGTIAADREHALEGERVTITATPVVLPDMPVLLSSISIFNVMTGEEITVDAVDNTAVFNMPADHVLISPGFTIMTRRRVR